MNFEKGKGRAPHEPEENGPSSKPEDAPSNPSILSRIAASASGLTHSALAAPNSNELDESVASALSNSGKATASSRNRDESSSWADTSKAAKQFTNSQPSGAARESFRIGHTEQHAQQSEREFSSFLDGIDSFQPSEPVENAKISGSNTLAEAWTRSQSAEKTHGPTAQSTTVTEQENRDGGEVVAMLSDPNLMSEHFEAPESDQEEYNWGLSAEQLTQLRAMTKDLFPAPEPHANVDPDHPLNLLPTRETDSGLQRSRPEASEAWRGQWEGVLTRYADEVWGGLLPLVKKARQEIEDMENDAANSEQTTALRRLGAILGHLQQR